MADWTKPFNAAYTWWRVPRSSYRLPDFQLGNNDPGFFDIGTEVEQITNITGGTIEVNNDTQTFESASINCIGPLDIGNDLLRCHLIATWEDGTTEDVVLGTFEANVPSRNVRGSYEECEAKLDGKLMDMASDAFESVLVVPRGDTGWAYYTGTARGCGMTFANTYVGINDIPVGPMSTKLTFGMTSESSEGGSKLSFLNALTGIWGYRAAKTDEYGRIRMQLPVDYDAEPVWRFAEGINATFLSDVTDEKDKSDVCNVVRVIYESQEATVIGVAVNDDPLSPYSTVSMGRRKVATYSYQDTVSQERADRTAQRYLDDQRSVVRHVTIQHVWCGARVGDIVEFEYPSAGISGKFLLRKQTIRVGSAGCMTTSELKRPERD